MGLYSIVGRQQILHGRVLKELAKTVMILNILKSTRPKQWLKNLMVFLPLVFSANESWSVDDMQTFLVLLLKSCVIFMAFVFASSAVYLFNDVLDKDKDIYHAEKKLRPIASGLISVKGALSLSSLFAAISVLICAFLVNITVIYIFTYLILMGIYSLSLRSIFVLDVLAISGGFVIRVLSGAVAIDVPVSIWLYICMALGSMFIALSKRYAEMETLNGKLFLTRDSLPRYNAVILSRVTYIFLVGTIIAYSFYTVTADNLPSNNIMVVTIPFVIIGMLRYQFLVIKKDLGEKPEEVVTRDYFLAGSIVVWLMLVLGVLIIFR